MKTNMTLKALMLVAAGFLVSSTCSAADGSGSGSGSGDSPVTVSLSPTVMATLTYLYSELVIVEAKHTNYQDLKAKIDNHLETLKKELASPRTTEAAKVGIQESIEKLTSRSGTFTTKLSDISKKYKDLIAQKKELDPTCIE